MRASNQLTEEHLTNELLVRSMDEELSGGETVQVERHLAACEACRARLSDLRRVSDGLDSLLQSLRPVVEPGGRASLASQLEGAQRRENTAKPGRTLARFGWALAVAATLAIGVSFIPFSRYFPHDGTTSVAAVTHTVSSSARAPFEVDGETFQYLPYSNPDLPLGGSHIVQMQVPISSLADAGVLVEPAMSRVAMPDRAVLADVLLGLDGQPIGVHVLSSN